MTSLKALLPQRRERKVTILKALLAQRRERKVTSLRGTTGPA